MEDISMAEGSEQRTITTKDGVTFTIYTDDVIGLTEEQFNHLAATVLRRKADYIVKDGVDITSLTTEQVQTVLNEISKIISDSINPLEDNLISISRHISTDHAANISELRKRGWYRDTVLELYNDIVNVIRESTYVRKVIIKFNPQKKECMPKFTFTVVGEKLNGEQGEVSIAFIEDNDGKLILAVTII
jgi:hypothetical protein